MTESDKARVGQHIAAARREKGLSLRDLAEVTGMSRGALSEMENGGRLPRPETLSRIAEALEIDWEDLFALAGYRRPSALPTFGPYLRSKYGDQLSPEQLEQLERSFRDIAGGAEAEAE